MQVGREYVQAKGEAPWARMMLGHWASPFRFGDSRGDWGIDVFDFKDDAIAAEGHRDLYDKHLRRLHRSSENQWSKALRLDALYRTTVEDEKAWYLDLYRYAGIKELNFVRDGRVYALTSYVQPGREVLVMDDLRGRARMLPVFTGSRRQVVVTEVGPLFLD